MVSRDGGMSRDKVIKATLDERSMGYHVHPPSSSPNILSYKQNRSRGQFFFEEVRAELSCGS